MRQRVIGAMVVLITAAGCTDHGSTRLVPTTADDGRPHVTGPEPLDETGLGRVVESDVHGAPIPSAAELVGDCAVVAPSDRCVAYRVVPSSDLDDWYRNNETEADLADGWTYCGPGAAAAESRTGRIWTKEGEVVQLEADGADGTIFVRQGTGTPAC